MPWRYFYSTDESDIALKAILAGQDIASAGALVAGVYEYRVLLDSDIDFLKLANDVRIAQIRALASPERTTQFGTILPTNFFDSNQKAAGCLYRDSDTLINMVTALSGFSAGVQFAQRDVEIQGSASLGTVLLTLSNNYKHLYNTPINGSVSDTTLVKAIIDSTPPAAVQTNAVCNQAMFDFAGFFFDQPIAVSHDANFNLADSDANCLQYSRDKKFSVRTTDYEANGPSLTAYLFFDFGTVQNLGTVCFFIARLNGAGSMNLTFQTSLDNVNWSNTTTVAVTSTSALPFVASTAKANMRYLRVGVPNTGGNAIYLNVGEVWRI